MTITQSQFNKLNEIALVLVRKVDTKTYDEMCEILNDIYKTDIAESEECAKEIPVGSMTTQPTDHCTKSSCNIRGWHRHTEIF